MALADGEPVDRAGGGKIVEVYPSASLQRWGLPHRVYKGADRLGVLFELVDQFLQLVPLELGLPNLELCRRSDDAFDAVVAAVTARAAALGLTVRPSEHLLVAAQKEGWIALPECPPADLMG